MPRSYRRESVRRIRKEEEFDGLEQKRFPSTATEQEIAVWREQANRRLDVQLEEHRKKRAARLGTGSGFRHDVMQRYLPAKKSMPSYSDRVRDMLRWIDLFGDRDSTTIEPLEIQTVREQWLTVGPKVVPKRINGMRQLIEVAEPLAGATVNHRLRALENFFTVVYPKLENPVRLKGRAHEAPEPAMLPRAVDYDTIEQIIAAMPDRGGPVRKGEKRSNESLAKIRVRLMVWAGIEPTDLARLPESVLREAYRTRFLIVPGRRKGKGGEPRVIPLVPKAMAALGDLLRLKAWGRFSRSTVLRAWKIGCVKVVGHPLRLKDIRHSFADRAVRFTKSTKDAQAFLGHGSAATTRKYAQRAMLDMYRSAMDAMFPDQEM